MSPAPGRSHQLVAEILSPYTMAKDVNQKRATYERSAVPEYWIVDPGNRSVLVYRLDARRRYPHTPVVHTGSDTVGTVLLPARAVSLPALFEDLPQDERVSRPTARAGRPLRLGR